MPHTLVSLQRIHRALRAQGYIGANSKDKRKYDSKMVCSVYVSSTGMSIHPAYQHNYSISRRREMSEALRDALMHEGIFCELESHSVSYVFVPFIQPEKAEVK